MNVIQVMIALATLLAVFNSDDDFLKLVFILITIFSLLYPYLKNKNKGNTTKNFIIINQNKDKVNIEEDGKNILNEQKESSNAKYFNYLLIFLKRLYSLLVLVLEITYLRFFMLSLFLSIWTYSILYFIDFNYEMKVFFIPYCLICFYSVLITYLFKNKYNNLSIEENNDYLKISIYDIPCTIAIFTLYYYLVTSAYNISFSKIFYQIILPLFMIIFLQLFTLMIFHKKQKKFVKQETQIIISTQNNEKHNPIIIDNSISILDQLENQHTFDTAATVYIDQLLNKTKMKE